MAVDVQVVFDAADPGLWPSSGPQAAGYVVQPPPDGFDSWPAFLRRDRRAGGPVGQGLGVRRPGRAPARGSSSRRCPSPRPSRTASTSTSSRGPASRDPSGTEVARADAERLVGLGARIVREYDEMGEFWIVLHRPRGQRVLRVLTHHRRVWRLAPLD